MANLENPDEMDRAPIPANDRISAKRRRRLGEEYIDGPQLPSPDLAGSEMEVPGKIDIRDSPPSEEDLIEIGQQVLDSPEQGEDAMEIRVMFDGLHPGHVFPESTYVNHGDLLCEDTTAIAADKWADQSYSTYYATGPMMPKGLSYIIHAIPPAGESIHTTRMSETQEYVGRDILGGFGPSRTPPMVAFKLVPAREEIERGITDFLRTKHNEQPAMVEVSPNDSRYQSAPRARWTLAIKRRGTDSYKCRLCVRGDTFPLHTTAFVSPPTAHR